MPEELFKVVPLSQFLAEPPEDDFDATEPERVEIAGNLTLQLFDARGFWCYEIDLERCTNSAQVLDFIFQVQGKQWATPKLMFNLLRAFDRACGQCFGNPVQGVFCSLGVDHKVKWPMSGESYVDGC